MKHRVSRRSHEKSRSGCSRCKQRRVKCDEKRPACSSCVRLNLECLYRSKSESESPGTPVPHNLLEQGDCFEALDLQLLHFFSTHGIFPNARESDKRLVQTTVVEASFKMPFLLSQILATSALYLSHVTGGNSEYVMRAILRHGIGLRQIQPYLENLTEESCAEVFFYSIMTCMYSFGSMFTFPSQDETYHGASPMALADCLELSRGAQSILAPFYGYVTTTYIAPLFDISLAEPMEHDQVCQILPQLERVLWQMDKVSDSRERAAYKDTLSNIFEKLARFQKVEVHQAHILVVICVMAISSDFIGYLRASKPEAFLAMAYFACLLHCARDTWWIGDWSVKLTESLESFGVEDNHDFFEALQWTREFISHC